MLLQADGGKFRGAFAALASDGGFQVRLGNGEDLRRGGGRAHEKYWQGTKE